MTKLQKIIAGALLVGTLFTGCQKAKNTRFEVKETPICVVCETGKGYHEIAITTEVNGKKKMYTKNPEYTIDLVRTAAIVQGEIIDRTNGETNAQVRILTDDKNYIYAVEANGLKCCAKPPIYGFRPEIIDFQK